MTAPLYVDVSPLWQAPLGNVARFVRRLVPELAREVPLRLIAGDAAPPALRGRDIPLTAADLPPADAPDEWAGRLLARPSEPHNPGQSRQCAALFTHLRPTARRFRREVGVLHDFGPLVRPSRYDEPTRRAFAASARALRLCDAVVAVSEAARRDAGFLSDLAPERTFVCPPGAGLPAPAAPADAVARRDDLVLVVTAPDPEAAGGVVRDWLRTSRALPPAARVCWVGPTAWPAALGPAPPGGRVTFAGRPTDAAVGRLYREAAFAVYPEAADGFPFPVLDALFRGCPVAVGYAGALTEFDEPGVFPFDPGDPETLDEAYRELRSAGPVAAPGDLGRRFAWRNVAQAVLQHTHGGGLACAS